MPLVPMLRVGTHYPAAPAAIATGDAVPADTDGTRSVDDLRSHAEPATADLRRGNEDGSQPGGSAWPLIALLLLATAALLVIQMRRPRPADPLVGQPLPPLEAAGWLNTDRPLTAADLGGKIVVIDFWASWCGECFAGLPDLVEFQDHYRDRDVMVVGMTNEPADKLPAVERFLGQVEGANWPNAYGAVLAHQVMNIEWLPTYVLYDRSGVSVWSGASVAELEDAVVELLAKDTRKLGGTSRASGDGRGA